MKRDGSGGGLAERRYGYAAELYRLVHRGNSGDRSFYSRACRDAASVLELGCGYGRLISALVPRAGGYVGVELDAGMLRLARQARAGLSPAVAKRVALVRGDMCGFTLARRFDRVVIPHSGLFCLGTDAQVLACLRRVRAHLELDGELIFDTYSADAFHRDGDPEDEAEDRWEWLTRVGDAERAYDVFERTRWQRELQRMTVRYRYTPVGGGRSRLGVIEHRYLLREQMLALLRRAGFRVLGRHGDFRGGRLLKGSELVVVRAARMR